MSIERCTKFLRAGSRTLFTMGVVMGVSLCWGAENWQRGNISEITTTTRGLMIRLDSGLPTNCTATPLGWMLIPEASKTMVATTLMLWLTGRRMVDVYATATTGSDYCMVVQVDPAD